MFGKENKNMESSSSPEPSKDINGFIGKGMSAEGKLSFEGVVRIEGSFKGDVTSAGTIIVGEGGTVEANLNGKSVV